MGNTVEGGPLPDVSATADDHFPSGNDFPGLLFNFQCWTAVSDMVEDDEDVFMRSQRILDDPNDVIMDSDEKKEDGLMDDELADEHEENGDDEEESDEVGIALLRAS